MNTHSLDLERGSSQYASITDANQSGLDITTGSYTFEAWINFETVPTGADYTGNQMILAKDEYGTGGDANRSYTFYVDYNKKLVCEWQDSSSNTTTIRSTNAIFGAGDAGVWHHVAVSFVISTPTGTLYLDGSPVATTIVSSSATSIRNGASPFAIGCQFSNATPTPVQCLDGKIDEVRIWSVARSEAEIANNRNILIDPTSANLVGYWRLENNFVDLTSNANFLTPSGSPVFSTDVPFTVSTFFNRTYQRTGKFCG